MMVSIPSMRLDIHVPHVTATGDDYHHNRYKKTSERKRPKPHPRYYSYNNDSSVSGNINDKSECRWPCLPSPRSPLYDWKGPSLSIGDAAIGRSCGKNTHTFSSTSR